jgi:methionyl aminopeptidase
MNYDTTDHTYTDGDIMEDARKIPLHGPSGFEGMRKAGLLAAQTLDYITPFVKPGVTTDGLDKLCHDFIVQHGAIPAPLGYKGFPKSICTSVNHVVCHGIPDPKKVLEEGDVVNIDVTTIVDGWHGDSSRMYPVGEISIKAKRLIDATYEAMMTAIKMVKPGVRLGDIGFAIQSHVEPMGFGVVRDFCGHGLGQIFHCAPSVMHYGTPGAGVELKAGMFFTIEPMINGSPDWRVKVLSDGWTAVTRDRALSAQFEHSIGVTEDGCEIFTLSPQGLHKPPYAA